MAKFPPFHAVTTDTGVNAHSLGSIVPMEFGDLQHLRPLLGGTHNTIETLLVGLQRCWVGRGVRRTTKTRTRVRVIRSEDQTVSPIELHFAECYEPSDRGLKNFGRVWHFVVDVCPSVNSGLFEPPRITPFAMQMKASAGRTGSGPRSGKELAC